jgi:ribose 5-phosphate isomerase
MNSAREKILKSLLAEIPVVVTRRKLVTVLGGLISLRSLADIPPEVLPFTRMGTKVVYLKEDVAKWLEYQLDTAVTQFNFVRGITEE